MGEAIYVVVAGSMVGYVLGSGDTDEARLVRATAISGGSPVYINSIEDEFGDPSMSPSREAGDYKWNGSAIVFKTQEEKDQERIMAIDREVSDLQARVRDLIAEKESLGGEA